MAGNLAENSDFHAISRIFCMLKICDMGPTALLPLQRKTCWGFFRPEKKNQRTWGPKASTLPLDHRSRLVLAAVEEFQKEGFFNRCSLYQSLETGLAELPPAVPLHGRTQPVPYFFVADDAFAMKHYVMKSRPFKNQPAPNRKFNYRFSRACRIVENVFRDNW